MSTSAPIGDFIPVSPVQHACPNCGYCPHCGRSNLSPMHPWPIYPWWGIIPPYPNPYTFTWRANSGNYSAGASPSI